MSIQRNIVASYVGQTYTTLVGILLVPTYIRYMGIEAYGLIGFFAVIQGWFQLLDMGLTPTIGREAARLSGGASDALGFRKTLRAFEGVFVAIGASGAVILISLAGLIANRWLRIDQLDAVEVQRAIMLMAVAVALRWLSGLYRGILSGFEEIIWLNGFNMCVATVRFVLVIPFLAYVGASPSYFFMYQLAAAAIEAAALAARAYRLLPRLPDQGRVRWEWQPLAKVQRFALSGAVAALTWTLLTQADKLILSGMVSLTDFAHFTLAVLIASGITMLGSPVTSAILPRLTKLNAQQDEHRISVLYRDATQLVAVITVPIVLVLVCFPVQVLTAWTGQVDIANQAAPVLRLYAVGNGVLAMAGFPYLLQVARGDLSLHLIGNLIFAAAFVPLLVFGVTSYGVVGAGVAWIVANLLPFVVWLPIVHHRFLRGLHLTWLLNDVGIVASATSLGAVVAVQLVEWPGTRAGTVLMLIAFYVGLAAVAVASSSTARRWLFNRAIRSSP